MRPGSHLPLAGDASAASQPAIPHSTDRLWNDFGFRLVVLCGFGGIGLLLYGHTLSFPFVFDDQMYLLNNPLLHDTRSFVFQGGDFSSFATYAERIGLPRDLSTNFILRPVAYLTFHLNYLLDGMNPRGFRAVNIALHCANAFLL
ncbi:MAG: hypothetical protein HZA89_08970, partial [Verrucomicrobia bacterium]|nr:hypothetical protein [Verrucomicrobiota bacterium]